jgi:hypothetical protein
LALTARAFSRRLAHRRPASHNDKVREVIKTIDDARKQGAPISEFSREMAKAIEYKELACESAARLAPYIHPRIGAVPVQADKNEEFVIIVPAVVQASDEWARSVKAKLINSNTDGSENDDV